MNKVKITIIFVAIILVLAFAAFHHWSSEPVSPDNPISFEIKPGGLHAVAEQLQAQNIPINTSLFKILVRITGNTSRLKVGYYELKAGETPMDLVEKLAKGLVAYQTLTIVEGWTFRQMREAIARHPSLKHDTQDLTDTELIKKLNISYDAPEGLFFPDTYFFNKGASDMQIYRQAHLQLIKKLHAHWEKRDETLPYQTPYEALIMASIVEKETGTHADRGKIAGVFTNRLKIGMRLQTDPTVIYGMGENYNGNIRKTDLTTDTPYNTYTRSGLPPTPIALPGEASIRATFEPEKTNALYFVARGDGSSHFSSNLSDHNRAVDKYQRKRRVSTKP